MLGKASLLLAHRNDARCDDITIALGNWRSFIGSDTEQIRRQLSNRRLCVDLGLNWGAGQHQSGTAKSYRPGVSSLIDWKDYQLTFLPIIRARERLNTPAWGLFSKSCNTLSLFLPNKER